MATCTAVDEWFGSAMSCACCASGLAQTTVKGSALMPPISDSTKQDSAESTQHKIRTVDRPTIWPRPISPTSCVLQHNLTTSIALAVVQSNRTKWSPEVSPLVILGPCIIRPGLHRLQLRMFTLTSEQAGKTRMRVRRSHGFPDVHNLKNHSILTHSTRLPTSSSVACTCPRRTCCSAKKPPNTCGV